ncbi:hypothetical protein O181_024021 [Austropuccinia psidii MF-1]|uniref:Uncharacterized protein n=1 Tax=Austropuccinia psidii MF-1 TaxID=1389203 RepID=A0A9Q3CFV7_9BASI|nr:hypothetical protein [Austropuccinia psidii MF-1]
MRHVNEEIEKEETIEGKKSQRQKRIEFNPPKLSTYSKPPKGLPIDFYHPKRFNNFRFGKKKVVADALRGKFLPDSSQSIHGIKHPDGNDYEDEINDDHIEEENSEMQDYKDQEFNTLLDRDTEMAHEQELDQFVVGGWGFAICDNARSGDL